MRTTLTAAALAAMALLTAAPSALAGDHAKHGATSGGGHAKAAERLMRAADTFDAKAGTMRTRAERLRATALELRQEAEDLAGDGFDDPFADDPAAGDPTATAKTKAAREHDHHEDDDSSKGEDGQAGDDCAWDGEDDLGFSREHDAEPPKGDTGEGGNGEEICHLLRMADRLEQRAAALDAAAARMEHHAKRLREKAAKLLGQGGEASAEQLLKQAAALRASAAKLRTAADALRDTAFEGTDIDDEAVAKIRRMELKAAAYDRRADRLEARAAKLVA